MKRFFQLGLLAFLAILPLAATADPQPVRLAEIQHMPAELIVVGGDGTEVEYSPEDLEQLPTYSLQTTTPWRDVPANFEGVLLKDILAANGLADAEAITVTAENDFEVTIPREIWTELDVLVATRVDGAPHSRRARGPIQFVIEMDSYAASKVVREDHLVWMAARIEAAE